MKRLFVLIGFFNGFFSLSAQPFDTLLNQFVSIAEVYPLADSTFIIIGSNNDLIIQRVDKKASVLWSVNLVSTDYDAFYKVNVELEPNDSTIQILTNYKGCDYYTYETSRLFNLDFNGKILDQQYLYNQDHPIYAQLLSGLPNRPRAGYFDQDTIILIFPNLDTSHVQLTWVGGDTTNFDVNGSPFLMTMCPSGKLMVGTGLTVFILELQDNRYRVVDQSSWNYSPRIICVSDQHFITVNSHSMLNWINHFPENGYYNAEDYISPYYDVKWFNGFLTLYSFHFFEGMDSLFVFDKNLELKYEEGVPPGIGRWVVDYPGKTNYQFGGNDFWFNSAPLVSIQHQTNLGPKFYDLEINKVEFGKYDEVEAKGWRWYYYSVPQTSVTFTNHSDYPVHEIDVAATGPYSFCKDTVVTQHITGLSLASGETTTITVQDLFAYKYVGEKKIYACIYAFAPDQHLDDVPDDNKLCDDFELMPISPDPLKNPIQHYPSILQDEINFTAPENLEFTVAVFDIQGRPFLRQEGNTYSRFSIDVSGLPSGLYVFQYSIAGYPEPFLEKIVKY